jgi:hypothetical protein
MTLARFALVSSLLGGAGISTLDIHLLSVLHDATSPDRASAEEDSLSELPKLHAAKEQKRGDDDNRPLPSDSFVLEYVAVDDRNVESWEDGYETKDDRPEEELVTANVVVPIIRCTVSSRPHDHSI